MWRQPLQSVLALRSCSATDLILFLIIICIGAHFVISVIIILGLRKDATHHHKSILFKCRSFTANTGTKVAVLSKGRSSTANSGTKVVVLLEINRCGSFPFLSAPHSLFNNWTDLKKIWKDPRGTNVEVRRVDLAKWALRTSPKFTTGVNYQFHQGFWLDQRSGNPNHPY